MRLQAGQHLGGETTNLMHEHLVRHRPAIQADRYLVGAGMIGGADDAFCDLVWRAPGHVLSLLPNAFHSQSTIPLATAGNELHVLGAEIVVRRRGHVAALRLQIALGDVAVLKSVRLKYSVYGAASRTAWSLLSATYTSA